ncbi:MAG: hypothetical protein ABIU58_05975 [Ramlibacter sp.]
MKTSFSSIQTFAAALCSALVAACGTGDDPTVPVDSRNATYTSYATNGERFTLKLDFDSRHFAFQNAAPGSPVLEGTFGIDAVAGTLLFPVQSGAGKTARFRQLDGLVAGNYNFNGVVRPFVGARTFAQNFQDAAGVYNNLSVSETLGGQADTAIQASRIDGDGRLKVCIDATIYTIDKCPSGSVHSYTLTISGDLFTAAPGAPGESTFSFRVARAGGEKVFLMADIAAIGTRNFRVGVAEAAGFRSGADWGGTVQGAWARADYSALNYSSEGVAVGGSATNYSGSLAVLGAGAPQGLRSYDAGKAYVMQNAQLTVLAGTSKGDSAGFMQIGMR